MKWMAENKVSPVTGAPLMDTKLTPNIIVKQILASISGI